VHYVLDHELSTDGRRQEGKFFEGNIPNLRGEKERCSNSGLHRGHLQKMEETRQRSLVNSSGVETVQRNLKPEKGEKRVFTVDLEAEKLKTGQLQINVSEDLMVQAENWEGKYLESLLKNNR